MNVRRVSEQCKATGLATVQVFDTIERGITGRRIFHGSAEHERLDCAVNSWFRCQTVHAFDKHRACCEFRNVLGKTAVMRGELFAFRGRSFEIHHAPTSMGFGPPPSAHAVAGRYNLAGKPALYLATSIFGVEAELGARNINRQAVFVQRFRLSFSNLKVADFTSVCPGSIESFVFDRCESEFDRSCFFRSQHLAGIVEAAGYNGMLVPGVRGRRGAWYKNLVIFDPKQNWKEWVDVRFRPFAVKMAKE